MIRLVDAVLAEQNDEWTETRRCMLDLLTKTRLHPIRSSQTDDIDLPTQLTAQPQ